MNQASSATFGGMMEVCKEYGKCVEKQKNRAAKRQVNPRMYFLKRQLP